MQPERQFSINRVLVIAGLLAVGAAAGLLAGLALSAGTGTDRPVMENLPRPALTPVDFSDSATRFSPAQLDELQVRPCFRRQAELADTPPDWLTRSSFGPQTAREQPARRVPDLASLPGLVKVEQIRSPGGTVREHCAATRFDEHWFITAAHCVAPDAQDTLIVAPGSDIRAEGTQILGVDHALCHSAAASPTGRFDDDVALLYVDDVSGLEPVPSARLGLSGRGLSADDVENAYFAGWGKNGDNRFLQGGPLRVTTIGAVQLLAEPTEGFGPCVGDSGGALYVPSPTGPRVIGLLSSVTRDACPPYGLAFYVRIGAYRDWIRRTVATCVQDGVFIC